MSEFSALPMRAYSWADPDVDLENPRFVASVEWTWPEGYENGDWTRFSIVRSIRSPVRRREEGQVMMEVIGKDWDHVTYDTGENRPVYRDPQPPPGEWVYYTAFVLDANRVWTFAGTAFEIGIADYDWALRLPETLPGVSIGDMERTISPAEQSNTLVQFLQNPGALLDRVVTMGEATQYFWDPLRVPPQMLEPMMDSIGYEWDDTLGIGRMRYVLDSLMGPQQGSLEFISRFVEGASGCSALVSISNNLMLDLNDSSFEDGDLNNTHWAPTTNLEVRDYTVWLNPVPNLHPNVAIGYFLHLSAADTITCGESDPIGRGIPVATWTKARMGCYAFSDVSATVTLGLKLYDYLGAYLRDVEILSSATTTAWAWYGSADDSAVDLGAPGFAYAVPYLSVSDACSVDLIVVDDG
jgi:hypothetical protein